MASCKHKLIHNLRMHVDFTTRQLILLKLYSETTAGFIHYEKFKQMRI